MFEQHIDAFKTEVPKNFLLNHLVGSFAETVKWWLEEDTQTSPETTAKYFIELTKIN